MAETCIVCLGDLRSTLEVKLEHSVDSLPSSPPSDRQVHIKQSETKEDDETIAHLLPCGHNLHDSCLKPWVERANSCPICRANFVEVELRAILDGSAFSSYAVKEKQQEAELDPNLVLDDDDLFEVDEPCLLCGQVNATYDTMYCDGCDRPVHGVCAGTGDLPEVWYCNECLQDLDEYQQVGTGAGRLARAPQTQSRSRRRHRGRNSDWARVWQSVWDRLNFDLDFPFDDENTPRTRNQRREFTAWQRRLQVANRQGGTNRFRETASTLLDQNQPAPESQEELRAWNAFDKARELHSSIPAPTTTTRKRKSITASPASPHEQAANNERKLKRPRTRRNLVLHDHTAAESSHQARQRAGEGPSFLTSLLQEVEKQPLPSSPDVVLDGQISPALSSPRASPPPSNHVSPRGGSVTPPPLQVPRPSSPTPLTSIVQPLMSPISASYSPFSPTEPGGIQDLQRGRTRLPQAQSPRGHSPQSPQSPSRNMSYSTKSEIQRMVKSALGARYRNKELSKDEYTDINRDVSRMLYNQIGDAGGLADQHERERWQQMASDAVEQAVVALRSSATDS